MSLCLDGNTAAAIIAYKLSDMCSIYPITPSSTMADVVEQMNSQDKQNLFGNITIVTQANSELGAAACLHGAAATGCFPSTFTSSQGLLLMLPNLYFISQQHLPAVIHLATRSIGGSSTTLSPDHSDVYALQNTSMSILGSRNVQEAHDLAVIAHCVAIESSAPFVNFFEGFRVSHQFETFVEVSDEQLRRLFNFEKYAAYKNSGVNPDHPDARGIGIGPELFYAVTEAQSRFFSQIPAAVSAVMTQFEQVTGRKYEPFEYYGNPNADRVIVIMGSASITVQSVVEALDDTVGMINIRLWKPFSIENFVAKIPKTATKLSIMDRSRDFVSTAEPMFKEVVSALIQANLLSQFTFIQNATYGLIGHDLTPGEVLAVFQSLKIAQSPKIRIGVKDDIFNLSLPQVALPESLQLLPKSTKELVLWGIGADGTIGAARNAMKILNDRKKTMQMQANFEFDGKKSGGITITYLRFGDGQIHAQYNPEKADYIACHCQSYISKYDMLKCANQNGVFMLNADYKNIEKELPNSVKRQIASKNLKFYVADCNKIAEDVGLGNRISTVTVMFLLKIGMEGLLDGAQCVTDMKEMARITYKKQSQKVIDSNMNAIEKAAEMVPKCLYEYDMQSWLNASEDDAVSAIYGPPLRDLVVEGEIYDKVQKRQFDQITTSQAEQFTKGVYPSGYSVYEKPGVSNQVAAWESDSCIQCNLCATACPHACIRPFLSDEPKEEYVPAKGKPGQSFKIQISPLDCRGCGVCIDTCPKQCLTYQDLGTEVIKQQKNWDDAFENLIDAVQVDTQSCSLKDLQYSHPYLFNPGSCPGCPETSLIRMLTTLFGKRLVISSAVGCCLVWGHYNQFRPYLKDSQGRGPALATSAFEDNALFGFGMMMAGNDARKNAKSLIIKHIDSAEPALKQSMAYYLENYENGNLSIDASLKLTTLIEASPLKQIFAPYTPYLVKRSHWIIGGDGWAFDIDAAGVDHIMSTNEPVKVLVMNNNCYANTGGQYSKSTTIGAQAKHASLGVQNEQKQLALQLLMYKNVYVAQIAMGADKNQTLKVLREAEAFDGPAFVVAYCPCIAHGIVGGLRNQEKQQKLAVQSGIWPLFRSSRGVLKLDSKRTKDVEEFLVGEQRFQVIKSKSEENYSMFSGKIRAEILRVEGILTALASTTIAEVK
ncbi:Pyruvate-flavodoxin oxidoreductase 2 [Spironucleus salmonicida]|uniref:Pyruvate-flavodoxin oxidoreductase 2 n=1 Tax=Spironucleus salmonicida TaxID=348837 RepID=K7R5F6_9EUKA|nr:pyruvate-flavodoxin oxidoreductase 2 [Spironucleus salmonicida]KAH0574854.1 Pyruvate-flavodoxin oxidoreductase 2 [Spironucleus salmonicida]|eukprot:EST42040.1 Pyruvate-flavodoxin oxidoreductase 2 [Spironucleus salmonicida]